MIGVLARVPALRLARSRRAWISVGGWALLAIASAIIARRSGGSSGSDHVMRGSFGYVVLPLVAYGVVSAALGGAGLRGAVRGVVALGAVPRRAALATTLVAVGASAAAGAVLAMITCALAHGPADAPLVTDLVASAWVSALGGAAWAAYFAAGSAIGSGAWRGAFLAVDWIVGSGAGALAAFTPRGHVTALLGGALCADMPARASSVFLVAIIAGYVALATALTRRA